MLLISVDNGCVHGNLVNATFNYFTKRFEDPIYFYDKKFKDLGALHIEQVSLLSE